MLSSNTAAEPQHSNRPILGPAKDNIKAGLFFALKSIRHLDFRVFLCYDV